MRPIKFYINCRCIIRLFEPWKCYTLTVRSLQFPQFLINFPKSVIFHLFIKSAFSLFFFNLFILNSFCTISAFIASLTDIFFHFQCICSFSFFRYTYLCQCLPSGETSDEQEIVSHSITKFRGFAKNLEIKNTIQVLSGFQNFILQLCHLSIILLTKEFTI